MQLFQVGCLLPMFQDPSMLRFWKIVFDLWISPFKSKNAFYCQIFKIWHFDVFYILAENKLIEFYKLHSYFLLDYIHNSVMFVVWVVHLLQLYPFSGCKQIIHLLFRPCFMETMLVSIYSKYSILSFFYI